MAAVLSWMLPRKNSRAQGTPASEPSLDATQTYRRRAQDDAVAQIARESSSLGREAALLNGIIDDVGRIAEGQNAALAKLAQSLAQMGSDTRAIGSGADEARQAANAARDAVERVGLGVRGASESLDQVFKAASEITQIALQTRLVAFNASVEAKRAGEAGRGFAVVADAVKDLSQKVEVSSKQIVSTIQALGAKIDQLSRDLIDAGSAADADTFQAAFRNVEKKIGAIAEGAARNLAAGEQVIADTEHLRSEIDTTTRAVAQAKQSSNGFLAMSERVLELTADTGADTVDSPYIHAVLAGAGEIASLLEQALADGRITEADLFDENYRPVSGTNPQQHATRFVQLTDELFPAVQERIASMDKVVFSAAVDRNGYLPTHNLKFSRPQGKDPVWNNANCRNRRIFNDRTGLSAGRNTRKFLLQTYRRDMGGGKYALMKDLSAPIVVRGRHWGGLRIGYQF